MTLGDDETTAVTAGSTYDLHAFAKSLGLVESFPADVEAETKAWLEKPMPEIGGCWM